MKQTLHILNGDSTLGALTEIGISGEKIVFRDVLCEGPVRSDIGTPEFWEQRAEFMTSFFGTTHKEFQSHVVREFNRLTELDDYSEIVLWFEYDLFCQINMLAMLAYLYSRQVNLPISLICSGQEAGSDYLLGLGELQLERLPQLFDERISLDQQDLLFAKEVFEVYCNPDPRSLFSLPEHPKFPYLKGALTAHSKRFPFCSSGLNEIESEMQRLIDQGISEPREIVGKMLRWQKGTYYGLGDLQYFNYLERVAEKIDRNYYLGGALVSDYCWDENKKELVLTLK